MDECKCATGHCGHWSDCAVHNEPAYPNGPCDCGGYPPPEENIWKRLLLENPDLSFWLLISVLLLASVLLAGCASKPVIQTQVIERLYPVYCEVQAPEECKDAYAVDRVSVKDDLLAINRALRTEIEERRACEVMLRAAVQGCNKK
ncbi:MAG: hypothetical protein ABS69_10705 [Nitrosomonadales bacterium SCN 54-20]|nr:MAG: hypothetical protein ABS69_10705 [Nitrosomonadales bacterium SCN 54-20]